MNNFERYRLLDPSTNKLLHMTAEMDVTDPLFSWFGYPRQAAMLRRRFEKQGKPFPYIYVDPDTLAPISNE